MSIPFTGQITRIFEFPNVSVYNGAPRLSVTLQVSNNPPSGSTAPETRTYIDVTMDKSVLAGVKVDTEYNLPIKWAKIVAQKGDIVRIEATNLGTKTYFGKDGIWHEIGRAHV